MAEVKRVSVLLSATGYDEAKRKIDELTIKAEELKRLHPEIEVQINSAEALAKARLLRTGIQRELAGGISGGSLFSAGGASAASANVTSMISPMAALVGAAALLSPVLVTLSFGMAGFGAAAFGAVSPVVKAAQATGGLQANMSKLNPLQRNLATSVLALGKQYDAFQKSLQPQVISVFNSGIKLAAGLLKDIQPVAKATGTALDGFLKSIDAEFRSNTWQQFFKWMAANVGPDMKLVGASVRNLLEALPPLLENLQADATGLLQLTAGATKLLAVMAPLTAALNSASSAETKHAAAQFAVSSGGLKFGSALQALTGFLTGNTKAEASALAATNASAKASKAGTSASKAAGNSIQSMGAQAAQAAAQVTSLYNSLHKLLDPLTQNIADAVTFKNDQVALAAALKSSKDVLGLHTAAQRASASAAAAAANDALTLSQSIYTQTGSARKAIAPLQALARELKNSGAKGDFARGIMRELQAAIDALKSKTITVNMKDLASWGLKRIQDEIAGLHDRTITVSTVTRGGPVPFPRAAGGWTSGLTLVGERGPELISTPGSMVYSNQQTRQMLSGASGGATYNVTVNALVADRNTGRLVVEAIRKFEQGSGSGWRKH